MKPVLYLDIDGVLFGLYGDPEAFQLRPGVTSFLQWTNKHFQLCWFTAWSKPSVEALCSSIYFSREFQTTRFVSWTNYATKELWLYERSEQLNTLSWVWIDDNLPSEDRLKELGLDPMNCIKAEPTGADELERLREVLQVRFALV